MRLLIKAFQKDGTEAILRRPWGVITIFLAALGVAADLASLRGAVPQIAFGFALISTLMFSVIVFLRLRGYRFCTVPLLVSMALLPGVWRYRGGASSDQYRKQRPDPNRCNVLYGSVRGRPAGGLHRRSDLRGRRPPLIDDTPSGGVPFPQTSHVTASLAELFALDPDKPAAIELRLAPIALQRAFVGDWKGKARETYGDCREIGFLNKRRKCSSTVASFEATRHWS